MRTEGHHPEATGCFGYFVIEASVNCTVAPSALELAYSGDRISRIRSSPSSAFLPAFIKLNINVMNRLMPAPSEKNKSDHFPAVYITHIHITSVKFNRACRLVVYIRDIRSGGSTKRCEFIFTGRKNNGIYSLQ